MTGRMDLDAKEIADMVDQILDSDHTDGTKLAMLFGMITRIITELQAREYDAIVNTRQSDT